MALDITQVQIPLSAPLDLDVILFGGQDFRWEREGQWYAGWLGDTPVRLRTGQGHLEVLSPLPQEAACARIRRFFRLEDDWEAIRTALGADAILAQVMAQWPGLRLVHQEPWLTLAYFICSTNTHIPRISRMVEALAQTLGEPLDFQGKCRWRFPPPEAIAQAGEERLRSLGLGYRAPLLWRTACLLAEEAEDLDTLALLATHDLRQRLLALPGVGDKVADLVLLLGFGRTEAFPIDRWVHRALVEWYSIPPPHTYRHLHAWAQERWGPWAGYAQLYLFYAMRRHSLQ